MVSFDVADSAVAVDFMAATLSATVLQHAFDAAAKPDDGLVDDGAARFLLAEQRALLLGAEPAPVMS